MNLTLSHYYGGVNSCNCEMLLFRQIFLLSDRLCKWNQLWRCCFLHFVYSPPIFSVFWLWFSFNKVTKLCNPLVFYARFLSYFINWGSWFVLAVLICCYFVKLLISNWPFCFYYFYWYLSAAPFPGFMSRIESLLHLIKNIEYMNYAMIYCIWSQECIFLQNEGGMRISCTETLVILTSSD
jgi:hypothetical protein